MNGAPTAIDVAKGCTTVVCRYTFGGYGHFNNQGVGTYDDFTAPRSVSSGAASQSFYVQYPPVAPGTAIVLVDGQPWTQVSSLVGQGKAYTLDTASGVIQFGDGFNGQIPPSGSTITITYDSGPHDGFVAFYQAMKAANPNVKVCGVFGLSSDPFLIQNAPQYDCLVVHPYIVGPASTVPLADYHPQLMLAANDAANIVQSVQAQIAQYQPNAEVILTEYGHLLGTGPSDFPTHFHLTLSESLFTANALLRWATLNVPWAERHRLVDWVFTPLPTGAANVGASDNSIIAGPAPFIAEPQAKVFGLFSRTMGTQRLAATIVNNPADTGSWGTLPNLEVLPTKWDDGSLGVIVINQSGSNDVSATVNPQGMVHRRSVNVLTVNGPTLTAYNTHDSPNAVDLVPTTVDAGNLAFDYTFPAHSVTGFRFATATVFDLINEQIALVGTTGGNSFAAQLQNARDLLSKGAVRATCNQMNAYKNHVRAQAGKQFDNVQAMSLTQSADLILSQIQCPSF
jgi:alpha-N-arabinofuranosidase